MASVRGVGELGAEHLAHRVTYLKHSANPCADGGWDRQRLEHVATANNDLAVAFGKPAFFDCTDCRDLLRRPLRPAPAVPALVHGREEVRWRFQDTWRPGFRSAREPAILSRLHSHPAQHHLRVTSKVLVNLHRTIRRLNGFQLSPAFAGALSGDRFCRNRMSVVTSVPAFALNAVLGSRTAPNRIDPSARWRRTAESNLVHGVPACDHRDHASGPDNVKALREKVVVYGARQVRTSAVRRIVDRIVAKWDVPNRRVKEVLGNGASSNPFA
jgi:hypothetical protein